MLFKGANILLLLVIAILTVSFVSTWLDLPDQEPDGNRVSGVDLPEPHQIRATWSMTAETRESRNTGTIKRLDVHPVGMAIRHQDTTVNDAATTIEPAERQAITEAARRKSEALPSSAVALIEPHTPGKLDREVPLPTASPASGTATKHPAVSRDDYGPWVINLVSTTSKAEAERFAETAWSVDLQTELQQVTLKGTPYWRVQITGFSTAEDASVYAETAKERLGLKDVWIMKHTAN